MATEFFRRNQFSLRQRITVSQSQPRDYVSKAIEFIMGIRKLKQYPFSHMV